MNELPRYLIFALFATALVMVITFAGVALVSPGTGSVDPQGNILREVSVDWLQIVYVYELKGDSSFREAVMDPPGDQADVLLNTSFTTAPTAEE